VGGGLLVSVVEVEGQGKGEEVKMDLVNFAR
jgi:hypothetical protein